MSDKGKIVPLFGLGVKGKSPTITAQRRLNCYVERYDGDDADKAPLNYIGRPGLTRMAYASLGQTGVVNGPCRLIAEPLASAAAFNYGGPFLPIVAGNVIWGFSPGGLTVLLSPLAGGLRTSIGNMDAVYNGVQQLFVDGRTGYVLNWNTGTVTILEDVGGTAFPPGATTCCFIGGRAVVDDPTSNGRFRWSSPYDFTAWANLDFATAESSADPLIRVAESNGEVLLLGRDTIEFWTTTADTRVFARIGGAGIDYGITAKWSLAKILGGCVFLGRYRSGGERVVFFLSGHTCTAISTPDVVAAINSSVTPDGATGFAAVIGGHPIYVLNLPTTTWVYDFHSKNWNEWQTEGSRHSVDKAMAAFGLMVTGDYRDGRICKYDINNFTDDSATMPMELVTRHVISDYNRFSIPELFIDFEQGDGLTQAMLSWSSDGGRTWGNEAWVALGNVGQYNKRATWRQLGRSPTRQMDRVFKLRITDNAKRVVTNAAMRVV